MIKINRRKTDKVKSAIASLQRAKEQNGSYNTPEVNSALWEIFHGKCYICENKQATSYQIEHLQSHQGNIDLKNDWNNLFLSCTHCNNTKLNKYEPILDCTKDNVDELIAFRKRGYFGTDEELEFEVLDLTQPILNTKRLLEEVYYGSTPQKKMEAKILRKVLRKELSKFKEYVREYLEADGEDKEDLKYLVKQQIADASPFAAFKRWLIRDNREYLRELADFL